MSDYTVEFTGFSGNAASFTPVSTTGDGVTHIGEKLTNNTANVTDDGASVQWSSFSAGGLNTPGAILKFQTTALSSGLHEIFVNHDFFRDSTGQSSSTINDLFYTDAGGGFHSASLALDSFDSGGNTFSVKVNATGTDPVFGSATFTVTDGRAFSTTATLVSQNYADGVDTLDYHLAASPASSGGYSVYIGGYDVANDGLASTPTLQVNIPPTTTGVRFNGSTDGESFQGNAGDDVIFGGGGSDTLSGGQGADTIGAGSGPDGAGAISSDLASLVGGQGADVIYGGQVGNDVVFANLGDDRITLYNASATVSAGQGNDMIDARDATGSNGAEATHNTLVLSGNLGNDTILGGQVSETVFGGQGDDSIVGGGGGAGTNELLFGNHGNDMISATSDGAVSILGGEGDDVLSLSGVGTGLVDRFVYGNKGSDIITVAGGSATVFGGQGNDIISATAPANASTHNVLQGDLGNDFISAGGGGDLMAGGQGSDTLVGGAGSDTFYVGISESTAAVNRAESTMNLDRFINFTPNQNDVIALQGHGKLYATTTSDHAQNYTGNTASNDGIAGSFDAAYVYAYGLAGSPGDPRVSHFGSDEYLSVSGVTIEHLTGTLLFVNDAHHTAVFLVGYGGNLPDGSVIGG